MSFKNGKREHAWDDRGGKFVANPLRRAYPRQIVTASTLGGTQVEHLIAIFQVPTGDWWIAYQHELLGYYPASLFGTLHAGACRSSWYGEVYRPANAPAFQNHNGAIKTEMGSGKFADAGFQHAAYVRNPTYYDPLWFGVRPPDQVAMGPYAPSCYTRSSLVDDAASGTKIFYLGGPGGNAPECQWP